jgi:triosephosphate isomerase
MRKKIIIGNWKMNGTTAFAMGLFQALNESLNNPPKGVEVAICPAFVFLDGLSKEKKKTHSHLLIGAQDVSENAQGAFTGQVSASMLKEFCDLVIVGHSERRHGCFETHLRVADKAKAAIDANLIPVVCVGETLEERESGRTNKVLLEQLAPVLDLGNEYVSKLIVAYEPVWAIGTGRTASPNQAQEVHHWIRKEVEKACQDVAQSLPILYGGSMKPDNAQELLQCPDIDGGLIGGASLEPKAFIDICKFAFNIAKNAA